MKSIFEDVYVVVPSINGRHLLSEMLPTLDIDFGQVIVVDQGSSDGTEDLCKELGVFCYQNYTRMTFTEACNKGVNIALERGAKIILICNNDIEFKTKVASQLVDVIIGDASIGVAAPTQIVRDRKTSKDVVVYGVEWDLSKIDFRHILTPPETCLSVKETDFCEFTCVAIRREVFDNIGLLDDDFGFYHEDADFCFRASLQGYRCVYVQNSQIVHYASSTFNNDMMEKKAWYIKKNKILFSKKYLNKKIRYPRLESEIVSSWTVINEQLHKGLLKYGLLDGISPRLAFGHPGDVDAEYLYTVWETSKLPVSWRNKGNLYRKVFVPSRWNVDVFRSCGYDNVTYLPLGVDIDVFNSDGVSFKYEYDFVFLSICRNQYRKGLDVTLAAWKNVRQRFPGAGLVLYGFDIDPLEIGGLFTECLSGKLLHFVFPQLGITILKPIEALSAVEVATLYRGADFLISTPRSEGFGFTVAEALASGLPAIFPNYGGTADFVHEGALTISGILVQANYSDKGFSDVGNWWEPVLEQVESRMIEAYEMDEKERLEIIVEGKALIQTRFTWRNTVLLLRQQLEDSPAEIIDIENSDKFTEIIRDRPRLLVVGLLSSLSFALALMSTRLEAFAYYVQNHGYKSAFKKSFEVISRRFGRS